MSHGLPMKRCSGCGQWKPLDAFNKLARAKDGRQWNCRDCNAAWHAANKARHNALIRKRARRIEAEIYAWLFEYKLERGCADCGERDPTVLEFDHVQDKALNVSALVKSCNWKRVRAEVAKCDVVCSNCHRRRTAQRANDLRWRMYLENQDRIAAATTREYKPERFGDAARVRRRILELKIVGRVGLEPTTTTG